MDTTRPPHDSNSPSRIVEALTGLSTLSAVWDANAPQSIAEDLCRAVLRSLPVRFACVCLRSPTGKAVEVVRTHDGVEAPRMMQKIGEVLESFLQTNTQVQTVDNVFGSGSMKVAIAPVGVMGDCGFLVAGSPNGEFPGQADQLFLTVAANQAAVVLQHQLAEQALQDSEQRFARFMQNLPGLAWIKDSDGRYVYANHGAEKAFRMSSAQLYGKTDEEVFPPETAARFRENDLRAVARPSGMQVVESLMHDDGVLHHSVVSKFPIPAKDGTSVLIGGIAFDITDRVQAEKTAMEASRQKDAFFAVLGHELRNPLSPMLTALQLMRLRGVQGNEIDILERQVTHMRRLVDDLLDVSRITSGKVQLHLEDVDLAAILVRALDTVGPVLEQRHHSLRMEMPRGIFGVRADPERLTQVVTNLLVNAAKFSDEGSTIIVDARTEEGFVRLSVRDEGIGISPEMLDTIFDDYVQRPESLDRTRDGLGLGLAIVRSLVRQHGGRVFARSDGVGKGSEFVVELPAVAVPERMLAAPTPTRPRRALGQRDRILVVDDNRDAAETLHAGLVHHGYDVVVAFDPAAAMKIAREFRPGIALLDIEMPEMNGYELAVQLRGLDELGARLRLVAVTGFGQPGDRERALAAGFDRHLVKPVDLKTLMRVVEELRVQSIVA
ncbi:MAG TPA: ATP-binding protein [Gemmatimonadaceae bacterium]|nr:ATP-binding protein [Gemmatimonadaceae bacterium]